MVALAWTGATSGGAAPGSCLGKPDKAISISRAQTKTALAPVSSVRFLLVVAASPLDFAFLGCTTHDPIRVVRHGFVVSAAAPAAKGELSALLRRARARACMRQYRG